MKIQKDCNCCGAVYTVVFTDIDDEYPGICVDSFDEDIMDPIDRAAEPLYCPFCGVHESEDTPTEFDEVE